MAYSVEQRKLTDTGETTFICRHEFKELTARVTVSVTSPDIVRW